MSPENRFATLCAIDGKHDVAGLNDGVHLAAFFQTEVLGRGFRNDRNEFLSAGQFYNDLVVDRSDGDLLDGPCERLRALSFIVRSLITIARLVRCDAARSAGRQLDFSPS